MDTEHRSGFVSVVGLPNAGKSTLTNALAGIDLSIVNKKPQTTRHRILSIISGEHYQMVLSDSPGYIKNPKYKLQERLNRAVFSIFDDSDICMVVHDCQYMDILSSDIVDNLQKFKHTKVLVLNKIDLTTEEQIAKIKALWEAQLAFDFVMPISALKGIGVDVLHELLVENLPLGPPYYPKDQLSDRSYRFFVSEIIREKILELYQDEVPYATQVIIREYLESHTKAGEALAKIYADIIVMRDTQKAILLGKGGKSIKNLGTLARKAIEAFIEKKVYLELSVKVKKNWRNDDKILKYYGY